MSVPEVVGMKATVFILYDDPLFAHGLECLLRQEGSVDIVDMSKTSDTVLDHIRSLKPDVILVEAETQGAAPGVLLSQLLKSQSEVRVISVSLSGSEAVLYTGRRVAANGVQDLIGAMGEPGGNEPC